MEKLSSLLQNNSDVLALATYGSKVGDDSDEWSDLDALVVVKDEAVKRFHPDMEWLKSLAEILAYEQFENQFTNITRICWRDLSCVDLVITTESSLKKIDQWDSIPFWDGVTIQFSKSTEIEAILKRHYSKPVAPQTTDFDFDVMVNSFWFKVYTAIKKVARNDLLIASHLTLELVQDCCVLAMMLRDRESGTNIHKSGGTGNDFVKQFNASPKSFTKEGLLASIHQSMLTYDDLASKWSESYERREGVFQELLGTVE